jgi:hypothetical protein
MTAKNVRILQALEPGESYTDPNFLMVETVRNKRGDAISTVDHVETGTGVAGWNVTALCRGEAMSHSDAMDWALAYAETHSIPVVYARDETATNSDTVVMRGPKV